MEKNQLTQVGQCIYVLCFCFCFLHCSRVFFIAWYSFTHCLRMTHEPWRGLECSEFLLAIPEDCTDCFGTQKKDEPNDKEKKEEEETSTSVHHSIIETWDWGRQPGEEAFDVTSYEMVPLLLLFIFHLSVSK